MLGGNASILVPGNGVPDLPTELFDEIFNFFKEDPGTLKACTLISRRTLQAAQHHLFSDITLHAHYPSRFCLNSYQHFLRLICESPHLATYVRHLSIFEDCRKIEYRLDGPCYFPWLPDSTCQSLPNLIEQLNNLEWFTFRSSTRAVHWHQLPIDLQSTIQALFTLPQGLSKVELFNTFGFLPLLRSTTGLKSLSLADNAWLTFPNRRIPEATAEYTVSRLDSLDIDIGIDLYWLMTDETGSWLDLSGLKSLILRTDGYDNEDSTPAFLRRVFMSSATLQHLEFHPLFGRLVTTRLYAFVLTIT